MPPAPPRGIFTTLYPRPFWGPKANQNRVKNRSKFRRHFRLLLAASWAPLGALLGLSFCSFGLLDRSWTRFIFQNVVFLEIPQKPMEFDEFYPPGGSQNDPRSAQNRLKSLPRASFFRLRFWLRFLIDFGPILAPKMGSPGTPFGSQEATKIDSKIDQNLILKKDRPKRAPRRAKSSPGRPQGLPRSSPGRPREARGGPRRPQELPREAKHGLSMTFDDLH